MWRRMIGRLRNTKFERKRKEEIVDCFGLLLRYSHGGAGEINVKSQSGHAVPQPKFEPDTSRIQVKYFID
jgi:hypothetical protein